MNWEVVGALGELVGAVAVVISLAYLSVQIRSNTRATKGSAGFNATHAVAQSNEKILELNQELKAAVARSYQSSSTWDEFTPEERADIGLLHRALFQKFEGLYVLHKYDMLDTSLWLQRRNWAASLVSLPFYKVWWKQELEQHVYTEEFVNLIESTDTFAMAFVGAKHS